MDVCVNVCVLIYVCIYMIINSVCEPNTGCCDGVDLSKKSKKLLCETFMKNCEPPELGRPVFDIEIVPA